MKNNKCFGAMLRNITVLLISLSSILLLTTFSYYIGDADEIDNAERDEQLMTPEHTSIPSLFSDSIQVESDAPSTHIELPHSNIEPDEIQEQPDTDIVFSYKIGDLPVVSINLTDSEMSSKLNDIAKKYNCVGVTLAAFNPHQGFFTYQYGVADIAEGRVVEEETKFRVASLSKIAGTIIAMNLVDDGLLDLDEDISTYLGYEVRNPQYLADPITCRMLVQHTASLYDTGAFSSGAISFDENTTRTLLNTNTVFRNRRPGEVHEYSDFGFAVLGAICESVSGKQFDDLARDVLFDPLGIDAAFIPANLQNKNVASQYNSTHTRRQSAQELLRARTANTQQSSVIGNLTISALDYVKILNLLTHGGTYDEIRVLSDVSVKEMHKANVLAEYDYMQGLSVRLLEGVFFGEDVYYHTGSAYGTLAQFFYSLDSKRIIVVITTGSNSGRGEYHSIDVCNEISELVWYVE